MKTNAAVLYETGKELVIDELEIPELEKGQVLVKVLYSGLCGSQLNEIKGRKGEDKYLPHLLGHEGSGIVEETGPEVKKVEKGDFVVLSWIKGSGIDAPSSKYMKNNQTINSGAISTFSQFSIISENRLVKVDKNLSPEIAALLGCAIPTGIGIVRNTLKARKGSSIAVFGVGGVGLSAVIGANLEGCEKIIAIDIHDNKLELAKEFGATHVINANKDDVIAKIKEFTDGSWVDYSVECSGVGKAMEMAFESINVNGTTILAGNLKKDEKISIDPFELIKGKKIFGTWGGETDPDKDIPFYANLCTSGELKLDNLITHKYKLEEINKALEDLENGKVGRALIKL